MIVDLVNINAIPSEVVMLVSNFSVIADQKGNPAKMILNIALDKEKAGTSTVEFPLYVSAENNYKKVPHVEMLNLFRIGAPFVPISCTDLKIYCKQKDNEKEYFATASSFTVVDYSKLEDIV